MALIKKAIIPIAGYGTRLFPATKAVPKALFPIIDRDGFAKPIIQLIIEEAFSAGVEQVCIVAQPHQVDPITDYFSGDVPQAIREKPELAIQADKLTKIGNRLQFAIQSVPEGFGHAIYCAKDFAADDPVIVLLGDHLYIPDNDVTCTKQLVDVYDNVGKSVTSLDICDESDLSVNGIVQGTVSENNPNLFQLVRIAEKPTVDYAREYMRVDGIWDNGPNHKYLCHFGIDLLTPLLFDVLDYNYRNKILTHGEIQLRDAMGEIVKQEGMFGYRIEGKRYDTGNPQELLKTEYAFGRQGPYQDNLI